MFSGERAAKKSSTFAQKTQQLVIETADWVVEPAQPVIKSPVFKPRVTKPAEPVTKPATAKPSNQSIRKKPTGN